MQRKNLTLSFIGLFFLFFIPIFHFSVFNFVVHAQTSITDTAFSVSVNDTGVQDGDIICSDTEGYKLCKTDYNSSIFGIVVTNPTTAIQITGLSDSQTVVSRGEVSVRVTSLNGNIAKGDSLTTSTIPGVAQLSTKNGYVIGTALEDYSSDDTNKVGKIRLSVNIHPRTDAATSKQNLLDLFRSGLAGLSVSPIAALRYILASAMVLTSFAIGFIYFGRIAKTGVEALGRNPLAGVRIELSVLINLAMMMVTVLVGLAIAYFILAI